MLKTKWIISFISISTIVVIFFGWLTVLYFGHQPKVHPLTKNVSPENRKFLQIFMTGRDHKVVSVTPMTEHHNGNSIVWQIPKVYLDFEFKRISSSWKRFKMRGGSELKLYFSGETPAPSHILVESGKSLPILIPIVVNERSNWFKLTKELRDFEKSSAVLADVVIREDYEASGQPGGDAFKTVSQFNEPMPLRIKKRLKELRFGKGDSSELEVFIQMQLPNRKLQVHPLFFCIENVSRKTVTIKWPFGVTENTNWSLNTPVLVKNSQPFINAANLSPGGVFDLVLSPGKKQLGMFYLFAVQPLPNPSPQLQITLKSEGMEWLSNSIAFPEFIVTPQPTAPADQAAFPPSTVSGSMLGEREGGMFD